MDDLGAFLLENEDHMVGLRVLAVIKRGSRRKSRNQATMYPGGGGYFLTRGLWGCAAGWGRIFTTGVTMMGSHIRIFLGKTVPHILG